ncbi:MAG: hypothetical protein Q8N85_03875 [Candidatus Omnitrophota bacterium]|nr:hypothetical protein [Candidatus Omnitrophota bacterium]
MRKGLLFLTAGFIAVVFALPLYAGNAEKAKACHRQQKQEKKEFRQTQHQENQAFRGSLKGKPAQEKQAAIKEHRSKQHAEKKAFRKKQCAEKMKLMRECHQQKVEGHKQRQAKTSTAHQSQVPSQTK